VLSSCQPLSLPAMNTPLLAPKRPGHTCQMALFLHAAHGNPLGPLDMAARRSAREARQELLARTLPGPAPLADSLACLDRACAQHAEPQVLRCGILF